MKSAQNLRKVSKLGMKLLRCAAATYFICVFRKKYLTKRVESRSNPTDFIIFTTKKREPGRRPVPPTMVWNALFKLARYTRVFFGKLRCPDITHLPHKEKRNWSLYGCNIRPCVFEWTSLILVAPFLKGGEHSNLSNLVTQLSVAAATISGICQHR